MIGSTDNSIEECYSLKNNDERIIVINKENEKVSKTRNRGIEEAKGEYITFVDSDDLIHPDLINELVNNVKEYDICTCNYYNINNNKTIINSNMGNFNTTEGSVYIERMYKDMLFNPLWNKIYKTEIIKKYKLKFEEDIQVGEDYLFNLNYISHISNMNYINTPLYYYTIQNNSLSKKFINKTIDSEMKILIQLNKIYKENVWPMDYTYNQCMESIKGNMINLINGSKSKKEVMTFINTLTDRIKEEELLCGKIEDSLSKENKIIYKLLYKNYLYYYIRIRNIIKKIIKSIKR